MRFYALATSTMMGFVASLSSSRPLFSRTLPTALSSAAAGRHPLSSHQYERKSVALQIQRQQGWFSTGSTSEDEKQLLLDPKAPLRPMLAENCNENHLSQYTLPPTHIGVDDYRPDLPKGQRIVAFGDVHGDITALRSFLVTAGILDPESSIEEPVWCGGTTICVQTGDVLDRGDDELACFRLLATLARQAHEAGGALLLLYGNHESLNAAGLFQYANPGGNMEFERTIGARYVVCEENFLIKWISSKFQHTSNCILSTSPLSFIQELITTMDRTAGDYNSLEINPVDGHLLNQVDCFPKICWGICLWHVLSDELYLFMLD